MSAQGLEFDVYNAVMGLPLESNWNDEAYLVEEPKCSSANWCTLANCIGFYVDSGNSRYRDWWLTYLDQAVFRFMGKEPGSRIYSGWIGFPVVCVYNKALDRNDQELANKCQNWLKAFWSYLALSSYPVQATFEFFQEGKKWRGYTSTFCGARSWERERNEAGEPVGIPFHIDAWALNWILFRVLNGNGDGNSFPLQGWDGYYDVLIAKLEEKRKDTWHGLSSIDQEHLKKVIHSPKESKTSIEYALNLIKNYKTICQFRFFRFSDGAATIMPNFKVSGATAPLYGFRVLDSGEIAVLSCDPGARPTPGWPGAVSPGRASVDLNHRLVKAERLTLEKLDDLSISQMALPVGEIIYEVLVGEDKEPQLTFLGKSSTVPNPNPNPVPNPIPVPNPGNDFFIALGPVGKTVFNVFNLNPKSLVDIGNTLQNIQELTYHLALKFLSAATTDRYYKKIHETIAGIFAIIKLCGEALKTRDESRIEKIKRG